MEGIDLHPARDERGVYRFDPDEVERVARGDRTPGAACGYPTRRSTKSTRLTCGTPEAQTEADLERMWDEVEQEQAARRAQREAALAEQRLEEQRRAEALERCREEQAELDLAEARARLGDLLDSLSPRELAKLPPELWTELEDVLE